MLKIKFLLLLLALSFAASATSDSTWHSSLEEAETLATAENKLVLLSFSGSDWCSNCIRLKRELFDTPEFSNYADSTLVLVGADFPRMKKNKLPKEQQAYNDSLASVYNQQGIFPYMVFLDGNGKVLLETGYIKGGFSEFRKIIEGIKD